MLLADVFANEQHKYTFTNSGTTHTHHEDNTWTLHAVYELHLNETNTYNNENNERCMTYIGLLYETQNAAAYKDFIL